MLADGYLELAHLTTGIYNASIAELNENKIYADHLRELDKRMTIVLYFPGAWGQRTEKQELSQVTYDHLG